MSEIRYADKRGHEYAETSQKYCEVSFFFIWQLCCLEIYRYRVMTVSSVSVLFAGFGSGAALLTRAVFVAVPVLRAVTSIVTVTAPPLGMSPSEQVTVPSASLQLPAVEVTETKRTLPESVSVSCTELAVPGPEFVTVRV